MNAHTRIIRTYPKIRKGGYPPPFRLLENLHILLKTRARVNPPPFFIFCLIRHHDVGELRECHSFYLLAFFKVLYPTMIYNLNIIVVVNQPKL